MQHFASGKRYAAGFPACSRRKTSNESVAVPNESFTLPANVGMAGSFKRTVRIMKLTAVLLTLAFLQVQAKGLGQDVTLNVKEEKLEKVLSLIEKQTGYVFFTTADLLKKARPVTLQVRNEALSRALDLCFKGQALDYVIQGKTISVVERKAIPVSNPTSINTEQIKKVNITGRVVNENDEPVAGATVMVKGSTYATATDEKGEFRLEEIEENSTLIITGANIETNEVKIRGRENVAIKVQSKVAVNEAVVVTVNTGYQDIPKERATGSFVQVDNELLNRRVSTNILDRLDGVTSGLLFNKNTLPGANNATISIRGRSTILANPNPLIILDNFPYDGNINNLNPNDIESISILKDAAAASIWGVRAGNGVIVLTTKKGKLNRQPTVSFNSNVTISDVPDLYYSSQLTSSEFIDVEHFLFDKGKYNTYLNSASLRYWPLSPVIEILARKKNGQITSQVAEEQLNALRAQDVRKDLEEHFYRRAVNQQYSLNINGGSEWNRYYISFGYDKNQQNVTPNNNNRFTINANNTVLLFNKNVEVTGGIIFTNSRIKTNGTSYFPNTPYEKVIDETGNPLPVLKDIRLSYLDTAGGGYLLDWKYRPLDENKTNATNNLIDYRINLSLAYKIIPSLKLVIAYQYSKGNSESEFYNDINSYYTRHLINSYSQVNRQAGIVTRPIPLGGIMRRSFVKNSGSYGRGQLMYEKTLNNDHDINALAGVEIKDYTEFNTDQTLYGYDRSTETDMIVDYLNSYKYYYNSTKAKIPYFAGQAGTTDRFISYYANVAYSYKKRYTLSGSARKDESNIFGVKSNQKGVPLWSIGASWRLSQENFYNVSWLTFLNFRATYGYSGNVDRTVSALTTAVPGTLSSGSLNNYSAFYRQIVNPPNPSLSWERVKTVNIGLDFKIKNNIVSGTVEYYKKNGMDLIGNSPIAPQTGIADFKGNSASLETQGVDVILNINPINRAFKWNTTLLFNYVTDKVTDYKIKQGTNSLIVQGNYNGPVIGKPYNAIFSYQWAGLDTLGNPQGYLAKGLSKNYTDIRNSTDPNELIYHGSAVPTIFGSIRNTFSWKSIELSFNVTYKLGYYFRRQSLDNSSLYNGAYRQADYASRWQKKGDELITNVPSLIYPTNSNRDNFYRYSDILVEKGDHIRLQDIQLSYELSNSLIKKLKFSRLQVYSYINNLGVLWRANKYNLDPDQPSGILNPRTYSIGINLTF